MFFDLLNDAKRCLLDWLETELLDLGVVTKFIVIFQRCLLCAEEWKLREVRKSELRLRSFRA